MRLLQTGNNFVAVIMSVGIYSAFHFATLEEYYTGTLYLPPLNGVSDGSFAIIIATIITGSLGNNFWLIPICDGTWLQINGVEFLTLGQIFAIVIGVGNFFTGIFK